jgi:hypothetical protein
VFVGKLSPALRFSLQLHAFSLPFWNTIVFALYVNGKNSLRQCVMVVPTLWIVSAKASEQGTSNAGTIQFANKDTLGWVN